VNVPNYSTTPGFLTVSYDGVNRRGIIQFATPITRDKLRIGVSDTVIDTASNALDGDANATAGGVLNFRFNILVGDASNDGSVNGGDLPFFAASFNRSVGHASFNPRANWNSDDSINGGDLPLFSANFNQSLPGAEPGSLSFPPPSLPLIDSSDEEELSAPLIDDYFSHFDEEDELLLFED
jgi:hypothetical protein